MHEGSQPAAAAPLGKGTVSHIAETYSLNCNIECLHLTNADTRGTPFTEGSTESNTTVQKVKAKHVGEQLQVHSLRALYSYRHKTLCF